jgi:hypothetical protein
MPSPFLHHGLVLGVPSGGDTSSFLQEKGETDVLLYQEDVLQGDVQKLNMILFSGEEWVFQQDSIPAQKPVRIGSACGGTFRPLSVPVPSGSPDLNSRDYKLWAVLEEMTCQKRYNSLDSLKRSLVKAMAEIPLETVRAGIASGRSV